MLRLVEPNEPARPSAYRVPWRVDRIFGTHSLITNASTDAVDFVRVFVDGGDDPRTSESWGQMLPGETAEMCLCDVDPDVAVVTLAWFRPDDGVEFLWRFVL